MPRTSSATESDWVETRRRWERGHGYASCSTAIDKRASATTIRRRAEREGWTREDTGKTAGVPTPEGHVQTREAAIGAGMALAARRGDLIDGLLEDAFRLRAQLFEPVLRREAKVVSGGKDMPAEVEIVDIELPIMPPAAQKDTALAFAIIMDKMLLLAGEATGRTETIGVERDALVTRARQLRDELAEKRSAKEIQAGQEATG